MNKLAALLALLLPSMAWAADPVPPPLPYVFQPGTTIQSSQVNSDFNYIVNNLNNWAASGVGVGTITGVTAGTGLFGGGTAGTVALSISTTGVTAGTYSCTTATINAQGQVTSATSTACGGGNGTVTSVTAGTSLTSSPTAGITTSGSISLAPIIAGDLLANVSATTTAPIAATLTALIDKAITSTQGTILYRGASSWLALATGTNGQFLQTQGASANPQWASGGTVTNIATGTGLTGGPITGSGTISLISPVAVANGGTGATAAGATAANNIGAVAQANNGSDFASATTTRANLVAAKSGANSDITSLSGLTTPLSVPQGGTGVASVTSSLPVIGAGAGALTTGARSGNTTTFATTSGSLTSGHSVVSDGSGNLIDGGAAPGSGTVTSITAGSGLTGGTITNSGTIALSAPVLVSAGGTGNLSNTAHGVMVGEGTSALAATTAGTAGQAFLGQGASSDPAFKTLSGDVSITSTGATTIGALQGTAITGTTGTSKVVFDTSPTFASGGTVTMPDGSTVTSAGFNSVKSLGVGTTASATAGTGLFTGPVAVNGTTLNSGGINAIFQANGSGGAFFVRSNGAEVYFTQTSNNYIGTLTAGGILNFTSGAGLVGATIDASQRLLVGYASDQGGGQKLQVNSGALLNGQLNILGMTQTSAAQSGTVCYNTGTGAVTYDATLGCLASLEEMKDNRGVIDGRYALSKVMALRPFWGTWKPGIRDDDPHEQPFLGAHQVEAVDPRLVGYGPDGKLRGVRYEEMSAVLVAAIQRQQAEIDELKRQLHRRTVVKKPH